MRLALLSLLIVQGACSSSAPPPPPPPQDETLESGRKLARFALESGNYRQAEALYEKALARARQRDDAHAIGDLGYELALTRLRLGKPEEAAEEARRTREELERRGRFAFAELYLVEAAAFYELGRPQAAEAAAREAISRREEGDEAVAGRANYLLGSIAADAGDATGLSEALAALNETQAPALQADREELKGRASLLLGVAESALYDFEAAAARRRMLEDYPGMARALGLAGQAAEAAGEQARAADLFFRAGRSAAEREDWEKAAAWLRKSLSLASGDPAQGDLAAEASGLLQSVNEKSGLAKS